MARYLLQQLYRGGRPGDIVELSEEEAANLLKVVKLPDSEPVELKPLKVEEAPLGEEEKPAPKRRTRKPRAKKAQEKSDES